MRDKRCFSLILHLRLVLAEFLKKSVPMGDRFKNCDIERVFRTIPARANRGAVKSETKDSKWQ